MTASSSQLSIPYISTLRRPAICALAEAPAFTYEYCLERSDGRRKYIKGYCCADCAAGLMKRLAGREAEEWAREEAELQAQHLDVAELQKRRLATFGNVHAR
jgi:hypothetical protein